ncbi:membrane protein insertase YidC [Flavihumibacter sp. RY-1]|uniref:Membrane protein insertase YidC n=1 Tax=Flavihumibacter fluminis TaxID=2909236 RepID=A0ABS9BG55_9BACT|nr:membrane protein insertase YidC [Flavihumibacter fluminis]MCF1714673.1 membrane protein insertase YidC [Flavihumibacter fluminis]
MQSMDRNTIIGFVLLGVLLFVYLFISSKNSRELEAQRLRQADSLAKIELVKQQAAQARIKNSAAVVTAALDSNATGWARHLVGTSSLHTVETNLLKVTFNNKGGQPVQVELKKYSRSDSSLVSVIEDGSDQFSFPVLTAPNQSTASSDLFFQLKSAQQDASGNHIIVYEATGNSGESIQQEYIIHPDSYLIDFNLRLQGTTSMIPQQNLQLQWNVAAMQQEMDARYEREQSQLILVENGEYDYFNLFSNDTESFDKTVQWASIKQRFFNATLINKEKFDKAKFDWSTPADDSTRMIVAVKANFEKKLPAGTQATLPMQFYFGPNDYKLLRSLGIEDMDKIVNLGQGPYAFVRPINQYIVMPVFDFIKKFFSSYGLVIALLTIFIRLITSPLVYSSYLSGAKMKALRPEIDALKAKYGDDQQTFGMEQMKLFREAGVNPLGGCIPALLQIPIFFALYSFFNSFLALRGESFLWATDLSMYDVIAKLPFHIPWYGDHVSLFTLTAVITSFLISIYNMNMTPDQNNPMLKYMPYIFPVLLLFFFNRLPSALTWYYTVSNLITLALQWVIQNYIIDHDKIVAQLAANRAKPKSKSKWQERLEQMQETQKKVQEMQKKGK